MHLALGAAARLMRDDLGVHGADVDRLGGLLVLVGRLGRGCIGRLNRKPSQDERSGEHGQGHETRLRKHEIPFF
ncbi:hypothetical protein D3C86_2174230 [compost metagenome]